MFSDHRQIRNIAMSELKPCPFCGSTNVDDSYQMGYRKNDHSKILYGAGCNDCGCQTELFETTELAVKAWNARHNGKDNE